MGKRGFLGGSEVGIEGGEIAVCWATSSDEWEVGCRIKGMLPYNTGRFFRRNVRSGAGKLVGHLIVPWTHKRTMVFHDPE